MSAPENPTIAELLMNMKNVNLLNLFACKPEEAAAAKEKENEECRNYYINLRDERNKKLLRAKKGRFVLKPIKHRSPNSTEINAYIEVDNNAWEE